VNDPRTVTPVSIDAFNANALLGGAGDDILSGAGGKDAFIFVVGSGADTLTDYQKGEALRFEGDIFSEGGLSVAQEGDHTVVSFDGHDVEVTVQDFDSSRGYTITQESDSTITADENDGRMM